MSENDPQSGHDVVNDAMGTIDDVMKGLGARARQFKAAALKEAGEIHQSFDVADKMVVQQLSNANARFRRFLGSNGGPALAEDAQAALPPPVTAGGRDDAAGS